MQITISETEIKTAILGYVSSQGLTIHNNAEVDLKAGRGEHGMTATIDIGDSPKDTENTSINDEPKKESTKKAAKPKAQEAKDDSQEKEPEANKPLFS